MGGGSYSKWVLYGLGILLFGIWVYSVQVRAARKRYRLIRAQQSRESMIPMTESIFVSISCCGGGSGSSNSGSYETVKALQRLFMSAYAPHRIFVGLCGNVPGIFSQYQEMSQAVPDTDFSDQIRSFVSPELRDATMARGFLTGRLYRREKYFLQLDSSCMDLVPDWDQLLIENLEVAAAQLSSRPALLTAPPVYWATKKPKPTFSRFAGFAGVSRTPALAPAAFATKKLPFPVPALFVSSYFLFCQGPVAMGGLPATGVTANDVILSAALHGMYDFFHPDAAIVVNSMDGPFPFLLGEGGHHSNMNQAFAAYSGVDLARYSATVRAFAGLSTLQTDAEQVQQKYGSWKKYMAVLTALGGAGG